jgi:hypothetical protein
MESTTQSRSFTPKELKSLRALQTPAKIQAFLDKIPYHVAPTAWSPRLVLRNKSAHCLEGAIFAAAALQANGYPPLIVDLEAVQDSDHVIAVYRENGGWGAIGSSNYAGCRYRSPVYRSLRELALSYFEGYFNLRRERTLRTFSQPVNLKRFDSQDWKTTEKPVWFIAEYLLNIPHTNLLTPKMERGLVRLDDRSFNAGLTGHRK